MKGDPPKSKEILSDEEMAHPLNEPLLKEAEEIKAERRLFKERLTKLDQNRQGVSDAVYQKVRAEYLSKLNATFDRLSSLRKELDQEEKQIKEKKRLIEEAIRFHQEKIEESKLRSDVGEVTQSRHQEIQGVEESEIKRLEEKFRILEEAKKRHRAVLEGEEFPEISETLSQKTSQKTSRILVEPSPQKVPQLEIIEDGRVIETVPVDRQLTIGRSPSNDIVLREPKVSRRHAEIQGAAGRYIVVDLESSNGTVVGGKKIKEYTLQPDDEIVIGSTKIVFRQN